MAQFVYGEGGGGKGKEGALPCHLPSAPERHVRHVGKLRRSLALGDLEIVWRGCLQGLFQDIRLNKSETVELIWTRKVVWVQAHPCER